MSILPVVCTPVTVAPT